MMSTAIASQNQPSGGLTWGKALKGVALVAAVAVAGVAAAYAIGLIINPAVAAALSSDFTLSTITGTAINGLTATADWAAGAAISLSKDLAAGWSAIPELLGITNNSLAAPVVAANAAKIGGTAQAIGAGAVLGLGGVAITPHLKTVLATPDMPASPASVSQTDTSSAAVLSQMKATSAIHHHDMLHTSADMAKHAGDHSAHANKYGQKLSTDEQPRGWRAALNNRTLAQNLSLGDQPRGWSQKFTTAQNAASIASVPTRAVASPQQPRDPNFTKQLDADRANLRDILGDGGRA